MHESMIESVALTLYALGLARSISAWVARRSFPVSAPTFFRLYNFIFMSCSRFEFVTVHLESQNIFLLSLVIFSLAFHHHFEKRYLIRISHYSVDFRLLAYAWLRRNYRCHQSPPGTACPQLLHALLVLDHRNKNQLADGLITRINSLTSL